MTSPRTFCYEPPLFDGAFSACAAPAVGPHPVEGYTRPLCRAHLRMARQQVYGPTLGWAISQAVLGALSFLQGLDVVDASGSPGGAP